MATQTYEVFFGTANAGGAPAFSTFVSIPGNAALAQPAFVDKGGGRYWFTVAWDSIGASTISYVATLNGVELYDEISGNPPPGVITPTAATQNLALYDTALTILNRAGIQLGIGRITDAYGSTDPNVIQLCEYLRQAADDINTEHDWTNLTRPFSFTTDGVSASYALPADFHEMLPDTAWNRSTRFPLLGPLSPQERTFLQARLPGVVLNIAYSIQGGLLTFPVVPAANFLVSGEYQSTYWVQSSGAVIPDKDEPTANDDVLLYDPDLILAALKLRYGEEKGIGDVAAFRARYEEKLEDTIGRNSGATVLSLGGGSRVSGGDRMIDGNNVPIGNWPT